MYILMNAESNSGGLDDEMHEPIIPAEEGIAFIINTLTARFGKNAMKQFRNTDIFQRVIATVTDASQDGNNTLDAAHIMDLANTVASELPKEIAHSLDPSEELAKEAEKHDAGKTGESADKILKAAAKMIRVKTIRNEQPKIGRNDPCPCGSGKHYKKCCLRKEP